MKYTITYKRGNLCWPWSVNAKSPKKARKKFRAWWPNAWLIGVRDPTTGRWVA